MINRLLLIKTQEERFLELILRVIMIIYLTEKKCVPFFPVQIIQVCVQNKKIMTYNMHNDYTNICCSLKTYSFFILSIVISLVNLKVRMWWPTNKESFLFQLIRESTHTHLHLLNKVRTTIL